MKGMKIVKDSTLWQSWNTKRTMQKSFSVNLPYPGKLQVLLSTDTEEYCVQGKTDYQ